MKGRKQTFHEISVRAEVNDRHKLARNRVFLANIPFKDKDTEQQTFDRFLGVRKKR